MKAAGFRYLHAGSTAEAVQALEQHRGEARILAGGQSLLAGLNMRLSQPGALVDINDVSELGGISIEGASVRLGALTRHAELQRSAIVAHHLPLLTEAIGHVGHVAIRNRGTLGGSLSNADPAAELPACMVALNATVVLASVSGRRELKAEDFFIGLFDTARAENELLIEVRVPIPESGTRFAFAELARRHGDFPIAGVAAVGSVSGRQLREVRIVYFGCSDYARPALHTSALLRNAELPIAKTDALRAAVESDVEASGSPGCRADTKNHLAAVLTHRAINQLGAAPHEK